MAFASLTIDLNARIANIEQDMGRVAHMMETRAKSIGDTFGKVTGLIAGLGGSFGFAAFIKQSIDAADDMRDLAIATGTSVQALASYDLAAKQSGTSIEAVSQGMGKLSLFMAKNSAEAQRLGITARDPAEAFVQLAGVLEKTASPTERNTLAFQILGKSYRELLPLLSQGNEALRQQIADAAPYARRMAEMADASDAFKDNLASIGQQAKIAGLALAGPLVNGLSTAGEWFDEAARKGDTFRGILQGMGSLGLSAVGIDPEALALATRARKKAFEELSSSKRYQKSSLGDLFPEYAQGKVDEANKALKAAMTYERELQDVQARRTAGDAKLAEATRRAATDAELELANANQALLRKAFDLKPLDDYIEGFSQKAASIRAEYVKFAQGSIGLGSTTGPASSSEVVGNLALSKSALAAGSSDQAQALFAKAKTQLQSYQGFDVGYLADQVKALELQLNEMAQKTAITARDALLKQQDLMKASLENLEPIPLRLATDAIEQDMRRSISKIREELAANPIQIPVEMVGGGTVVSELSRAALKLGAR